ncbi:pentatricopeptide repeat-containing protein At4g19220, mitochondrial-like [Neltuma alba]|uniref:pentatricopeptide repeat-containing protein At4g19220, mitochondrial-like n=1 Tax=Neltuma alba TaxID=207710 RepID=UPI0010A3101F|nr:pentatricopeptide repeat-containing protein At4g19220, mitochondrial-like [Prosopis alba]
MRAWTLWQFMLKSASSRFLVHITRLRLQNLALLPPTRLPSPHPFSLQNSYNGDFEIVRKHMVPIPPCALPALLFTRHFFHTAIQPFDEMPQRVLNDLINSSSKKPKLVTVSAAHCIALKTGTLAHLPTVTSLLTIYCKAGDFSSSRVLFDEIHDRDVIAWNSIIAASVKNKLYKTAMDFFGNMIKEQCGFDCTTLLLLVSTSSYMNNLEQGRAIHCLSVKTGMLVDISLSNALTNMYAKCGVLKSSECLFSEIKYKDVVSWNSMIKGSLHNGEPKKSLYYFKDMVLSGEEADSVSLSCAISASTALGELDFGQSIHELGMKLGYLDSQHVSVPNSLISLYIQCGDIEAAETVFREMECKDIVSWNAMMEGYASNGSVNEVFDLLLEMQTYESFQPDTVTLTNILKVCAVVMLSREGRTVHGFAIRRQMLSDLTLLNSLIDMYSKCKLVEKTELLFNSAHERDLVSWNAMIYGYSINGYSQEAQSLFRELLHFFPSGSSSTVLAVLSSCSSTYSLSFGKSVHCWQLKLGFLNHIPSVNSLIHMYINCGDLTAAFLIFQENSALAVTASWNTLIVGCVKGNHYQEALETFSSMRRKASVNYDSITLVNVLSACANLELLNKGRCLHGLVLTSPLGSDIRVQNSLITMYGRCRDIKSARSVFEFCFVLNLCSWNCMISALSHNKESRDALELFLHLPFKPSEITVVSVLTACTQMGVLRHSKQVHAHIFRSGFQDNAFISAALVDMYSNGGRLDLALQVFTHAKEKSEAAWNSMISAYGYHGNGERAINLFHEMRGSGIRATKSTFVSLLSACSHSRLVNEGLGYYNCMLEKYGVQPETEHQVYVVDMLGRSGRLDEAYEFIKKLPSNSSPGLWGALLSACNYHGELKLGRKVSEILFEMDPQNVGYYISLANMYVAAGSWKDATELRQTIQDQGLRKTVAYSLIDVGLV